MSSTKLKTKHTFSRLIFASRWLQLPIYLGLIAVQAAYAWKFLVSLFELLRDVNQLSETHFMLSVLGLIDVVMIANLLVMVTIGGYETFVSRLNIDHHPDQPEWLDHVNASVLKVKLSMALISISSIHLLKTFISAANLSTHEIMWQLLIHCAFLFSAAGIALTDKLLMSTHAKASMH